MTGEVNLPGGGAMALELQALQSTKDVDPIFVPPASIWEETRREAEQFGLGPDWLN